MIINLSKIDFGGVAKSGGGNVKPEETFDVQPTTTDQTITPTEGSVFSGGTVRAVTSEIDNNIAAGNIKEGVTILGVAGTLKEEKPEESFNVQPTTSEQTITPAEGSVFSGGTVHAVTSAIDSNIQPENIKEGVSILGVAGTLSEGITPTGTIAINLNGTYDITNYASAEVNVGDTPDYRYMKGTVDRAGLKAIGWTDEDILTFEQNITPHYTWQNDQYKVSDENKALYLLDDPNPSSYKSDPNIEYVPKKNMESYFYKDYEWGGGFENMKYIKGIPFYNTSNVTNMSHMFYECTNLTTIPLLDTSNVTNMGGMFEKCSSLTTIPQLNTSNATNMSSIFRYCSNLTTVPLLDTSKATGTGSMFADCTNLTSVPLLDTSKVTSMNDMFSNCSSLTSIPQLNTSNVKSMLQMFTDCISLTTIPLLDTSNVTDMTSMFVGCNHLTTIPKLNTSNVTKMLQIFNGCSNLTTIPQLDTSKVTDMGRMFYDCSNITTIPQLDTSKVTNMKWMFERCSKLTTVEGIDFSGLTSELKQLFGYWTTNMPNLTKFIVNGKINVSISDNSCIKALTAIDYDSVKSILAAADRTDNTNAKELAFNRTMTDQNGELAALVASCTSKGWTISGLTLQ